MKVACNIPDGCDVHLQYTQKVELYQIYQLDSTSLYAKEKPTTLSYFLFVWKQKRKYIKIRKVPRFQNCSTCKRIRGAIHTGIEKGVGTAQVLNKKNVHLQFVGRYRRAYGKKTELAKEAQNASFASSVYLSLIIDGADQNKI